MISDHIIPYHTVGVYILPPDGFIPGLFETRFADNGNPRKAGEASKRAAHREAQ